MTPLGSHGRENVIAMYVPNSNMLLIYHMSHMCQLLHVDICDNYVSIYLSYEPNATTKVIRNTDIHTFHIIAICP